MFYVVIVDEFDVIRKSGYLHVHVQYHKKIKIQKSLFLLKSYGNA